YITYKVRVKETRNKRQKTPNQEESEWRPQNTIHSLCIRPCPLETQTRYSSSSRPPREFQRLLLIGGSRRLVLWENFQFCPSWRDPSPSYLIIPYFSTNQFLRQRIQ